ncbi:hypothetical protein PMKS-003403 [Pichia membranifaciens]|uniref:Myb-like domain-containing protein n=1 Tax=Pichia membranifaciens TaxID=4926 RepID=A0A1Q2YK25_9ASCO|nr:hypothetical protein PMKS-003403 [Pichia membranifaciens]
MLLSVQPAQMTNEYSFSKQTQEQDNRENLGEQWEREVEQRQLQQQQQQNLKRQQNQQSTVYSAYQNYQDGQQHQQELTQQSRLPMKGYPRDNLDKPQGGYAVSTHQYAPPIQQPGGYLFSVPNSNGYVFQQVPVDEPKYSSDYNYHGSSLQPSPQQQAVPLPSASARSIMSQYPPFPSLVDDTQRGDQLYANQSGLEPYNYRSSLNAQYYPAYNGAYLAHPSMSPIQSRAQSMHLNLAESRFPQQYYGQMVPLTEGSYEYQQQQQQQLHIQQLQQLQLQQQQLLLQQQQLQEAHHKRKYKLWSEEEDQRLLDLKRNKLLSWKDIATRFSDRTLHACQFRWRKISPYLDDENDIGDEDYDGTEGAEHAKSTSGIEETLGEGEQEKEMGDGDGGEEEKNNVFNRDRNVKDGKSLPSRTSESKDEPMKMDEDKRSSLFGDEGNGSSSTRPVSRSNSGPREMKIRNILN